MREANKKSMLDELAQKLDEVLEGETPESLQKWLNEYREKNGSISLEDEAINDIICIARLNDQETAFRLIKSQFVVLSHIDLISENQDA